MSNSGTIPSSPTSTASPRYLGDPYEDRDYTGVSVLVEIDRRHTWGDPAREAALQRGQ